MRGVPLHSWHDAGQIPLEWKSKAVTGPAQCSPVRVQRAELVGAVKGRDTEERALETEPRIHLHSKLSIGREGGRMDHSI